MHLPATIHKLIAGLLANIKARSLTASGQLRSLIRLWSYRHVNCRIVPLLTAQMESQESPAADE